MYTNSSTMTYYMITGGVAALGFLTVYLASSATPSRRATKAGGKLPPGPKRTPFIGNLQNFPKRRWYENFTEWQKVYGDIVYVNIVGTSIVILNSLESAEELLGKRANLYSSRPYKAMTNDLMGAGWTLMTLQPGSGFNAQRKVFRKAIGVQAAKDYDGFIEYQIEPFLQGLANVKGDPLPTLMSAVGAVIIRAGYGDKIYQEHGKELVRLNRVRSEMISRVFQQFWLVDVFPILRHVPAWFPGATFRRIGEEGLRYAKLIRFWAYGMVTQAVSAGTADESVISKYLSDSESSNNDLRDAVAAMYAAGADTTATSIANFFYSLLAHPAIQRKVHQELDDVMNGRLSPSLDEITKLEYFNAVWKESKRYHPVVPLAIPHVNSDSDIWNGFYVPKGSIVMPNIGFMLRDPRIWGEDSDQFNPKRFLVDHNPNATSLPDMNSLPFGFGRRICPGRFLAERIGLQFAAAVVSAFEILPVEGETIDKVVHFDDSVVRRPSDFSCQFKPRR